MNKLLLAFLIPTGVMAAEGETGAGGFRGLSITPSATIQRGEFIGQYQNRVLGYPISSGHNFTWVLGLSDAIEAGGRVAATDMHSNLFTEPGIRDLSASFKLQANPLLGLQELPLKLAIGSTDFGGAATLFRSTYAVATVESSSWWSLSGGYAKASGTQVPYNPLQGSFFGASARLLPQLSARLERTQQGVWASLSANNESLLAKAGAPEGASLYLTLNRQLSALEPIHVPSWVSVGIKWPLDGKPGYRPRAMPGTPYAEGRDQFVPSNRTQISTSTASMPLAKDITASISATPAAPAMNPEQERERLYAQARALAKSLTDIGFESVNVGFQGETVFVSLNDSVFDHSLLDGAGTALGILAQADLPTARYYRLIHARGGTPTLGFSGEVRCLQSWMERYSECDRLRAVKVHYRQIDDLAFGVSWQVSDMSPSRYKPRLKLNPVHDMYFATEAAFIQYSLGLQAQPYVELWKGGSLEVSKVYHAASTHFYTPGQPFAFTRIPESSTTRTILHHTQRLKHGFSARASVGQLFTGQYRGGAGELRWDSPEGEWAHVIHTQRWIAPGDGIVSASLPIIENGLVTYAPAPRIDKVRAPTILTSRFSPSGTDWSLEVQAGTYWYRDKGLSISSNHWFGDTRFSFFFRRSIPPEPFWPSPYTVNFLGLEVSFPLTPEKGMKPEYAQIKGSPRYGLGVGTPVGRNDNYIVNPWGVPIYIKALVEPPIPNYLASSVMDFDRAGPNYVEYHLDRLRAAYDKWVKKAENTQTSKSFWSW